MPSIYNLTVSNAYFPVATLVVNTLRTCRSYIKNSKRTLSLLTNWFESVPTTLRM